MSKGKIIEIGQVLNYLDWKDKKGFVWYIYQWMSATQTDPVSGKKTIVEMWVEVANEDHEDEALRVAGKIFEEMN